ncbi:unnamed protein product [Ceratitis capitata]|uniref:(Mediterranean fruit fly) hypothetical protein n=1 Tax=Ceratitis capitata TaxID=7213 RepID=A0A811VK52_CERCA|nr:unnamed protein product [Ceratitis capitata]
MGSCKFFSSHTFLYHLHQSTFRAFAVTENLPRRFTILLANDTRAIDVGSQIYVFRIFTMPRVGRACNAISSNPTHIFARKFRLEEAFAYCLVFSTFLISLCFVVYIAYELEFKLPPWDNIFISFALFIPHFALAGALKLYTLNCWLMQEELRGLKTELQDMLIEPPAAEVKNVDDSIEMTVSASATNHCVNMPANDIQKQLDMYFGRFEKIVENLRAVSTALEKELCLLFIMNSSCLLAGVYTLVYFRSSWYLFFSPSWRRIFYAANLAIYVLIFWDYLCLCISIHFYSRVKLQILAIVEAALKLKTDLKKDARSVLKNIRRIISTELSFGVFNVVEINTLNLIMVHIILGTIISIVVVYHYLNDQIASILTRLDTVDSDD